MQKGKDNATVKIQEDNKDKLIHLQKKEARARGGNLLLSPIYYYRKVDIYEKFNDTIC